MTAFVYSLAVGGGGDSSDHHNLTNSNVNFVKEKVEVKNWVTINI